MDHLLNQCNWSIGMWKEGLGSFNQTKRGPGSIQEILLNWEEKVFKNPIVRCLWELLLGFTMWNIWKERNDHIFEGRSHSPEDIWNQTQLHIIESLGLRNWESANLKADQTEARILSRWGINNIPIYIGLPRTTGILVQSPENWDPPSPRRYTNSTLTE